jgi:nitrate/nitrite transporter NarK
MFILEGLPAVIVGIVIFLALPDRPSDAKWLSRDQKDWLNAALAQDPARPQRSDLGQTLRAFLSPAVLILSFVYLASLSANLSLAFFLPQIVGKMGLSNIGTGFVVAIPSLVGTVGLFLVGWLSDHFANHRALLVLTLLVTALGLAAAAAFGASGASVIGIAALSFAAIGIHGLKAPFWSLAPLTLTASATAGSIAWINSVGNLGGFFGPGIMGWLADRFGGYQAGIYLLAALQLAAMLLTLLLHPRQASTTERKT